MESVESILETTLCYHDLLSCGSILMAFVYLQIFLQDRGTDNSSPNWNLNQIKVNSH